MTTLSRIIQSNQQSIHPDLLVILNKHINNDYQKPITAFNQEVFDKAQHYYQQNQENFILDSGCGIGESTYHIARKYPQSFVIGIDQSAHRLHCNNNWELPKNAFLIRADLIDFWRLAAQSGWQLKKHFLLYPNPWPKKKHLKRRWHGHPVFPILIKLGGILELRSNWKIYAEEFSQAITHLSGKRNELQLYNPQKTITPFERKYQASAQDLYRITVDLE